MKAKLIFLCCAFALVFACTSRYNRGPEQFKEAKNDAVLYDKTEIPPPPTSQTNADVDKKIIKTAYLNIEVSNYVASRKLIDSTLKETGAFIISENLQNTESQISNSINIKVPAAQLEKLLGKLSKIAKRIDSQSIETQDVTEEYIDVTTRLNNSKKVEQTYLKLLKRTATIEDILKIEQKLGEIRTDIESTEGRIKYLNHQVEYSSINLNVYQTLEYKYNPEKLPSFFQRLKRSLSVGWYGIVTFFLFLIKLWPLWVIAALGWFGWKYYVRVRKQIRKERKRRKKLLKREEHEITNQEQN